MRMSGIRTAVLLGFLLPPGAVIAQERGVEWEAQSFSKSMLETLASTSERECRDSLAARRAAFRSVDGPLPEPLRLVVEGHRLLCEAKRILAESARLQAERGRLLTEIERLDARFARSGKAPYPGHDKSQQIMRADARALARSADRLQRVADDLESEASRILQLAVRDLERQDAEERARIVAGIDADAQREIFDDFRDLLPRVSAWRGRAFGAPRPG